MPAAELQITSNAAEVAAELEAYAGRLADMRPAFSMMLRSLREAEAETFASEGGALGVSWPPPADPSLKSDPRLLVATGRLMNSLAEQTGDSVAEVSSTELHYGTDVPYARFQQYGTGNMPARPFLGITRGTADELLETIKMHLEQGGGE